MKKFVGESVTLGKWEVESERSIVINGSLMMHDDEYL